jgi:hypothetical protein
VTAIIAILSVWALVGPLFFYLVGRRHGATMVTRIWREELKPSTRCAPERIRQNPPTRGGCGVLGCQNKRPHSHVADLVKKLAGK